MQNTLLQQWFSKLALALPGIPIEMGLVVLFLSVTLAFASIFLVVVFSIYTRQRFSATSIELKNLRADSNYLMVAEERRLLAELKRPRASAHGASIGDDRLVNNASDAAGRATELDERDIAISKLEAAAIAIKIEADQRTVAERKKAIKESELDPAERLRDIDLRKDDRRIH